MELTGTWLWPTGLPVCSESVQGMQTEKEPLLTGVVLALLDAMGDVPSDLLARVVDVRLAEAIRRVLRAIVVVVADGTAQG